jgi:hypothetical protein
VRAEAADARRFAVMSVNLPCRRSEQQVALADAAHVEVGVAVVVDVGKRHAGAGAAIDSASPDRSVMSSKRPSPEVAVERARAGLVGEVEIEPAVAVDVGHRHAGPVVVVSWRCRTADVGAACQLEVMPLAPEPIGEMES